MNWGYGFLLAVCLCVRSVYSMEVIEDLRKLYPELSEKEIRDQISNLKNASEFNRTFVALFYRYLLFQRESLPTLKELCTISAEGCVLGDPHQAQFLPYFLPDGRAVFGIDDTDDFSEGFLVGDPLRFFSSIFLTNEEADFEPLFEAYQAGLRGEPHKWSAILQEVLKKANHDGFLPRDSDVNKEKRKLNRTEEAIEAPQMRTILEDALAKNLSGNIQLLDFFQRKKKVGGSFNLTRYRVLILLNGEPRVYEFKQLTKSSTLPFNVMEPEIDKRMAKFFELSQGGAQSDFYKIVSMDGAWFFLKLRSTGNRFEFENLNSKEREAVLLDEAFFLGNFQKRTAQRPPNYEFLVDRLGAKRFEIDARFCARKISQAWEEVRSRRSH